MGVAIGQSDCLCVRLLIGLPESVRGESMKAFKHHKHLLFRCLRPNVPGQMMSAVVPAVVPTNLCCEC